MQPEEAERSAFAELLQHASALDRIASNIVDHELLLLLFAARRQLDAVLTFLADRYALPPKSRQQLLHERQHPWDKL